MGNSKSIQAYNDPKRAIDYTVRTGFDPDRKEEMLEVTLECLTTLAKKNGTILELGAGSGLFTKQIIEKNYFSEIYVTDGAPNMLKLAKDNLPHDGAMLHFNQLDFGKQDWSTPFKNKNISAVTSSMALHHAENKQVLFNDIFHVLQDDGMFIFADHIAGTTPLIDKLIGTKRARIRRGNHLHMNDEAITQFITEDNEKQAAEGNVCESVSSYLQYLEKAGFVDVDCIWRDYWLAVFIARKGD